MKNGRKSTIIKGMDKDSLVTKLLKSAYEKSGKTHADICKDAKVDQSYVSRLFNGRQYASLAVLIKIGNVIGLETKQITAAYKKDKIAEIDAEIAQFQ